MNAFIIKVIKRGVIPSSIETRYTYYIELKIDEN